MRGRVNTTGVPEGGVFEPIPAGSYLFVITECGDEQTQGGDPMVAVTLEVAHGEHKGRYIWDRIVIPLPMSPAIKILGRTKHFLHCIGEPYEGEIEYDTARWIGKRVQAEIFIDTYNGKKNNKVSNYILDEWPDEEESPV